MIAIADSGSTKTDWLIVDNQGNVVRRLQMEGLNPYHLSQAAIYEFCKSAFSSIEKLDAITSVYFYGAGCSGERRNEEVRQGIAPIFPKAVIEVSSDILGAARALFHRKKGIAIILGTGSNSVIYNGKEVVNGIQSLGYILGDEGSGAYLGRLILQAYFRKDLDKVLEGECEKKFDVNYNTVLENIYRQPAPNKYLASFSVFAGEHKHHPLINKLITRNFEDYFKYQLGNLDAEKNLPLGVVGSIGYHFSEIFTKIAARYGYEIKLYLQKPIDGLLKYHGDEL